MNIIEKTIAIINGVYLIIFLLGLIFMSPVIAFLGSSVIFIIIGAPIIIGGFISIKYLIKGVSNLSRFEKLLLACPVINISVIAAILILI